MPSRWANSARGGRSSAATTGVFEWSSSTSVNAERPPLATDHFSLHFALPTSHFALFGALLRPFRLQRPQRELQHPLTHLLHEERLRHAVARLRIEKQLARLCFHSSLLERHH